MIFEKNNNEIRDSMLVPHIVEHAKGGDRLYDLYSRMLRDRLIFLTGEITPLSAELTVAQMMYLESEDPDADIYFYINSPGGSVSAGMAIYDTMQYIKPDVCTLCLGEACSMASLLLAAGAPGKRYALPHAYVMIHQPMSGFSGQATDLMIRAKEIERVKTSLIQVFSAHTGQSEKQVRSDTERDNYFTAEAAKEYGLIDRVIANRGDLSAEAGKVKPETGPGTAETSKQG